MSNPSLKVVVETEDRTKQGLDKAKQSLTGFEKSVQDFGKTLSKAFAVTAIVATGKQILDFGKQAVTAFAEVEIAQIRLRAALGPDAFKSLDDFSKTLEKFSASDADGILEIASSLAAVGRTEPEIKKIVTAANNLANATGVDLQTAMTQVNATLDGSAGKLGKMVPALNGLTEASLKSGKGLDVINEQMGKISEAMSESMAFKIKNMTNGFDDFKKALGGFIAPAVNPFVSFVTDIVTKWTDAINEHTRYRAVVKKGEQATAAELLKNKQSDLAKVKNNKEADVKVNIGDFNDWFKKQIAAGMFKLTGSQLGDDATKATARSQYDEIARAFRDIPSQVALAEKIKTLTLEIEELTKIVKETTPETGLKPAGTFGVIAEPTPLFKDAFNNSRDVSEYDIQGPMIQAEKNGQFDFVKAMETFLSFQPEIVIDNNEGLNLFNNSLSGLSSLITSYKSVLDRINGMIRLAEEEALFDDMWNEMNTPVGVGGIGRGSYQDKDTPAPIAPIQGVGGIGRGTYKDEDAKPAPSGFEKILLAVAEKLSPLAVKFGEMLGSVSSLSMIMNPLTTILSATFEVITPLIDSLLMPLVGILKILGMTLGMILVPFLQQMAPVIQFITAAFVWLYNYAIVPLANIHIWFGVMLQNIMADMFNAVRKFVKGFGWNIGDKIAKTEYSDVKLTTISLSDVTGAGDTTGPASSTANASYSSAKDINIYINYDRSYINGDAREIALNLRNELRTIDALGL